MVDIEKRVSDLETQSKRFRSHLESEQRVYGQHGQRLTEQGITLKVMSDSIKEIKDSLKAIDGAIRDSQGIHVRLDRLEQLQQNSATRWDKWVAILAVLISLASVLMQTGKI